MGRPGLTKLAASLENPVYLLRAPLARLLFVLALTQMSYASAVKKFHELGSYLVSLKSYLSGLGEHEEPSNFEELSKFFAEGPSRCRFPKYQLPAPTLQARYTAASLQAAAEAMTLPAIDSADLQTSHSDSLVAVVSKHIIKDTIIKVSRRKPMIQIGITVNLMNSNGEKLATA